jgi:hypothetical protein
MYYVAWDLKKRSLVIGLVADFAMTNDTMTNDYLFAP